MARQYAAIPVRYDGRRGNMPLYEPDPLSDIYRQLREFCHSIETAAGEGLEGVVTAFSGADDLGGAEPSDADYSSRESKRSCDKPGHRDRSLGNDQRKGGHKKHWKKIRTGKKRDQR